MSDKFTKTLLRPSFQNLPAEFTRVFASKDVKKEKGKVKGKVVNVSEEQLQEVVDFAEYESSVKIFLDEFRDWLAKQFALRTNSNIFIQLFN